MSSRLSKRKPEIVVVSLSTLPQIQSPEETASYVQSLRDRLEAELLAIDLPREPAALYDSVRYMLAGGGKRFRPVLTLLAAEAFGGEEARERAMPAALAVEVFHNFTLVHDDIMDRADERRGRQTVHVRWDEATAILCGDFMMGLAYDSLARIETDRTADIIRIFHRMVARLCEGQALDMAFERSGDVSVAAYLDMIERKTAALLEAALEIGALIGGADEESRARLCRAGRDLGRAFQIQDDLLDLTADDPRWGKTIGGDLMDGKRTFLLLTALEKTEGNERAFFSRIVEENGLAPAAVPEARARMESLNVLQEARDTVDENYKDGLTGLKALPAGPAALALQSVVERLMLRGR